MKDALGNELKVGDLVLLNLQKPQMYARVAEIKQGGIVTGMRHGKPEVHPSRLVLVVNHVAELDPDLPAGHVMRLVDPEPLGASAIAKLAELSDANQGNLDS